MSADATVGTRAVERRQRPVSMPAAGAAGAWLLPFAAIAYLALEGGGYATVVRGQVGIALWWMVLVGAVVGVLPAAITRRGWIAIAVLVSLLGWTLLSLSWTESIERTFVEVGRVAAILGALVLGLAVVGRSHARHVINGIACAVGLVAVLAVLSRLHPSWFPQPGEFGTKSRLSYPVNYWNALAGFVAMGLPAVLAVGSGGRTLIGRSVGAAALPVMGLCVFLTISRGGLIASIAGLVLFIGLAPNRLPKVGTLFAALAGTGVLVAATSARDAVRDGLDTSLATSQANELLVIALIVVLGTAGLQLAISLIDRHATPAKILVVSRSTATKGALATLLVAIVLAVVGGAPGALQNRWDQFKQYRAPATVVQATTFDRLASASGNGRYQFWQASAKAQQTRPLEGRGAGTFRFWWARTKAKGLEKVDDAHSLYMQTFAELGIPGLVLIVGFLLLLLGSAVMRCLRGDEESRLPAAAAGAGILAFAITASVEWVWQITVLPVTLVLLGAVALAGPKLKAVKAGGRGRIAAIVMAVVCLPLLAISVAGATGVADSQAAANRGDLAGALQQARSAQRIQPYAATPRLQEALVLEAAGDLPNAAKAIAGATEREPTNSDHWLIRSRIEAELGHAKAAVRFFEKARSLNPYALIFQQVGK